MHTCRRVRRKRMSHSSKWAKLDSTGCTPIIYQRAEAQFSLQACRSASDYLVLCGLFCFDLSRSASRYLKHVMLKLALSFIFHSPFLFFFAVSAISFWWAKNFEDDCQRVSCWFSEGISGRCTQRLTYNHLLHKAIAPRCIVTVELQKPR